MRAIVYDPDAPHGLHLGMAPDPEPGPHEALVEVHAIALNFGEVAFLAERRKPGWVIGWECAGVVAEAAADGPGPPAGARRWVRTHPRMGRASSDERGRSSRWWQR